MNTKKIFIKNSRFTISIFLLFNLINIYSINNDSIKPQKIIFLYPEKNNYSAIEKQIIDETSSILDQLDIELKIIYVKEKKWIRYKNYLKDIDNIDQIINFFILTDITGIVLLKDLYDQNDKNQINIMLFNIYENSKKSLDFNIFKSVLIENLNDYNRFMKNQIMDFFKGIDILKLKREKIKKRIYSRKNPIYEIILSGGLGYYSRQSFGGNIISFGFTSYANLDTKIYNFQLNLHMEFSPLFNNPNNHQDNKYFLYNFLTSIDGGGWILNQSFKLGIGCALSTGNYYNLLYKDQNRPDYYETLQAVLFIPYLNFSFIPTRSIQISLDIGILFSASNDKIQFFTYFPVYIKFDFKYYFYKQLFYEISIPYYIVGLKDSKNGPGGSFHAMVNMGFGWRFEFWKEYEKK